MLQEIIQEFSDKNGYIVDFISVISYLKERNITDKEINEILIKINENNLNVSKKIKEEIDIQKKFTKMSNIPNFNSNNTITSETQIIPNSEYEFPELVDISYYTLLINNTIKEGFNEEELNELLPKIYDTDFYNIINTLLLHYKKEIVSLKKMKKDADSDFLQYIEKEENFFNSIVNGIIKYRNSFNEEEKTEIKESKMNIIFDPNTLMSDIGELQTEHYQDFAMLLECLSKNVLKGVKTFTPFSSDKITSELRYNQCRVVFDKIDNETYLVYYIFLKKGSDSHYHDVLKKRVKDYINSKKQILKDFYDSATKEDFIASSNEKFKEVIEFLSSSKSSGEEDKKLCKKL